METLVDFLNFHASGKFVGVFVDLTCHELVVVVLILNFAENLFHEVLECDHAACAAKLVEHDGHGAFLVEQLLHHLARQERLGGEEDGFDASFPVYIHGEQLAHLDEAYHVVDFVAIDHDFAQSGARECVHEFVARGVDDIDCHDFVAWHHAVA